MEHIKVVQPPGGPICDFCGRRPVKWRYPARDISPSIATSTPEMLQSSIGDWAACDTCHDLIEAADQLGLAERSAKALVDANPSMERNYNRLLTISIGLQAEFFAARCGPAKPVEG